MPCDDAVSSESPAQLTNLCHRLVHERRVLAGGARPDQRCYDALGCAGASCGWLDRKRHRLMMRDLFREGRNIGTARLRSERDREPPLFTARDLRWVRIRRAFLRMSSSEMWHQRYL